MIIHGRYQLQQKLGAGGMGIVWRAADRLTGATVALKQVNLAAKLHLPDSLTSGAATNDLRLALANEFQILAGLRHPHIISVLDYGFDEQKRPFFTMSYLPAAQNILAAAKNQPLEQQIELVRQLLQALAYLHRRGVLHRDLKLDNVLVQTGTVRVVDFGLSAVAAEAKNSAGTPLYMAPELFANKGYTLASDLYAVGVIFCQLLTGKHPFGPLDYGFVERVLFEAPKLDNVIGQMRPLLEQLLAKKPEDRFASAAAALAAIAESAGRPLPAETRAIRESYLHAARFVGRNTEMAQLNGALAKAGGGSGATWLIAGESGVGKTRLMREIEIQAHVDGFLVLRGQAIRDGGGLPYQLWREALRHMLVISPEIDDLMAGVLLPLVPDMASLLGRDVPPAPVIDEKQAQVRLFTTIARLFQQQNQPTLLLLDDLQWAEESLLPLPYLTRQIGEQSLLILGSYRDDERPLLPTQLPDMELLMLPRLDQKSVAELSIAILGEAGKQAELLALLNKETEGNAFFVVEVVRALAEQAGQLAAIGHELWPETLMPDGIQTIVNQRLARVPESARHLLELAAVAGRELDMALLQQLAPEVDIENRWLPVCAETTILEVHANQWRFSHDKLREGLLAQLEPWHNQHHNVDIATALERLYGEDDNYAARLAFHWGQAGNKGKQRHYAYRAGIRAAAQFANEEALNFYKQALALTAEEDLIAQYEIHLAIEKVYQLLGATEAQAAALARLDQLAGRLADAGRLLAVRLRQAHHATRTSQFATAIAAAQEAVALSKRLSIDERTTEAHLCWGNTLHQQGEFEAAQSVLTKGLHICRQLDDQKHAAAILGELGFMGAEAGAYEQAYKYLAEALVINREIDDPSSEIRILNNLGVWAGMQQMNDDASHWFGASLRLAQKIGDKEGEAFASSNLGIVKMGQRLLDQAQQSTMKGLQHYRAIGNRQGEANALGNLGRTMVFYGAYAEAYPLLAESLKIRRDIGSKKMSAHSLSDLGLVTTYLAEYEQAQIYLAEALAVAQALNSLVQESDCLFFLGHLAQCQSRLQEAQDYYRQADRLFCEVQPHFVRQSQAALAQVSVALGQNPEPYLSEMLDQLAQDPILAGTELPGQIYLNLFRALEEMNDTRADDVLRQAYQFLREMTGNIQDVAIRQSSLERVKEHQEIIRLHRMREGISARA